MTKRGQLVELPPLAAAPTDPTSGEADRCRGEFGLNIAVDRAARGPEGPVSASAVTDTPYQIVPCGTVIDIGGYSHGSMGTGNPLRRSGDALARALDWAGYLPETMQDELHTRVAAEVLVRELLALGYEITPNYVTGNAANIAWAMWRRACLGCSWMGIFSAHSLQVPYRASHTTLAGRWATVL